MLRTIFAAVVAFALSTVVFGSPAEARRPAGLHPDCNVIMPCDTRHVQSQRPRRDRAARVSSRRQAPARTIAGYIEQAAKPAARSVGLDGVVPALAAKAREIQNACGSAVISAVRHTRIRGSGRLSLHASGQAVDMAGNPACIYEQLQGWPGGYSTDYGRVRHVHISLAEGTGREMGLRFTHGGGRKARRSSRGAYATATPR